MLKFLTIMRKLINRSQLAELAGVSNAAVTKACKNALKPALVGRLIDADHETVQRYIEKHTAEPIEIGGIDPLYDRGVEFLRTQTRPSASKLAKKFRIRRDRASALFKIIQATGVLETKPEYLNQEAPPIRPVSGQEKVRQTKKTKALADLSTGVTIHEVPEDIEAFADMTLRELIQRFGTDTAFCDWLKATKSIEDINEKRIKAAQLRGELVSRELVKHGVIEPIDSAFTKLLTDVKKTIATRIPAMVQTGSQQEDLEKFIADQIGSIIRPTKTKIVRSLKNA